MIIRIKKVFFSKICKLLALMFYLVASVNYGFKGENMSYKNEFTIILVF